MTHYEPFFYIARLVLETCTPLSIASGRTDGIADNLIVRDANGLPAIPGSSLAGVLRHAYQRLYDPDKTEEEAINTKALFGSDKKTLENAEENAEADAEAETGSPSLVQVSWGCLHNSMDQPIEGLLDPDDSGWKADEILKDALQSTPIKREHVRLNHRGNAKNQGKFDRTSLTTGHRFSVEISLWSDEKEDPRWERLLKLLKRPDFRLGGGTRRGLGKLKMVTGRCYTGQFNLKESEGFQQFSELAQSLTDVKHLQALNELTPQEQWQTIKLKLTPLDGYRFGGGTKPVVKDSQADLLAVTENCVIWENNQGKLAPKKQLVIPASSIKGALSHRVAYHYNVLAQKFSDEMEADKLNNHVGEKNEAVRALFGYVEEQPEQEEQAKQKTPNKKELAQIGCLIFDDIYRDITEEQITEYTHNSIDRFTGGVRDSALFSEEVITDQQTLSLDITVVSPLNKNDDKWKAFKLALTDLIEGRLALGAGGGRGHGYFSGEISYH